MNMNTTIRRILYTLVTLWLAFQSVSAFHTFPILETASLAQSVHPDAVAVRDAAWARTVIPMNAHTTILYVNGIDGGDNYYRFRYLLYPVHMIDYWSWNHPDPGGYVWNAPRFSRAASVRALLLENHVQYVVATNHPNLLNLLDKSDRGFYVFAVDQSALRKHAPFVQVLREVRRWG